MRRPPTSAVPLQGVEDDEQLPHARHEGVLLDKEIAGCPRTPLTPFGNQVYLQRKVSCPPKTYLTSVGWPDGLKPPRSLGARVE